MPAMSLTIKQYTSIWFCSATWISLEFVNIFLIISKRTNSNSDLFLCHLQFYCSRGYLPLIRNNKPFSKHIFILACDKKFWYLIDVLAKLVQKPFKIKLEQQILSLPFLHLANPPPFEQKKANNKKTIKNRPFHIFNPFFILFDLIVWYALYLIDTSSNQS